MDILAITPRDYAWTRPFDGKRDEMFNNEYFKILALRPAKIKDKFCVGTLDDQPANSTMWRMPTSLRDAGPGLNLGPSPRLILESCLGEWSTSEVLNAPMLKMKMLQIPNFLWVLPLIHWLKSMDTKMAGNGAVPKKPRDVMKLGLALQLAPGRLKGDSEKPVLTLDFISNGKLMIKDCLMDVASLTTSKEAILRRLLVTQLKLAIRIVLCKTCLSGGTKENHCGKEWKLMPIIRNCG